jgi:hypothetical protein
MAGCCHHWVILPQVAGRPPSGQPPWLNRSLRAGSALAAPVRVGRVPASGRTISAALRIGLEPMGTGVCLHSYTTVGEKMACHNPFGDRAAMGAACREQAPAQASAASDQPVIDLERCDPSGTDGRSAAVQRAAEDGGCLRSCPHTNVVPRAVDSTAAAHLRQSDKDQGMVSQSGSPTGSNRKRVLVTGGTGTVGCAMVAAFTQAGHSVSFQYNNNETAAKKIEMELSARAIRLDFNSEFSLDDSDFDILVNNAGVNLSDVNTHVLDYGIWAQTLAVNLTAPFLLIRSVLPAMIRRRWGRILNISSIYGLRGASGRAAYAVSKHGLSGHTRSAFAWSWR